jgi:hypothetical protein
MPERAKELVRLITELETSNDALRKELLRHKRKLAASARRVETGELTAESILAGGAPEMRMDLTVALDDFEKARHQVRVALFGLLGIEHDTSQTEIGRSLGISRQLASRLAQEAAEYNSSG